MKKNLADAVMWTYHGREFPAPTFELGIAPAGCMYSTVLDLAKFQSCLFAGGKVGGKQLLKPETIAEMFRPQFAKTDGQRGFGLGFVRRRTRGHRSASATAARSTASPPNSRRCRRRSSASIVVSSRDVANAVATRIANDALRLMLAAKAGKPLPKIETSEPLPPDEAQRARRPIPRRRHAGSN